MSKFYAYDNHHRDRGRIHRGECQWCNQGQGVQGGSSGANDHQWHGPFDSARDAYAKISNRSNIGYRAYCRPKTKRLQPFDLTLQRQEPTFARKTSEAEATNLLMWSRSQFHLCLPTRIDAKWPTR